MSEHLITCPLAETPEHESGCMTCLGTGRVFQSDKHPDLPPDRVRVNLRSPRSRRAMWILALDYADKEPEFSKDLRSRLSDLGYRGPDANDPVAMTPISEDTLRDALGAAIEQVAWLISKGRTAELAHVLVKLQEAKLWARADRELKAVGAGKLTLNEVREGKGT